MQEELLKQRWETVPSWTCLYVHMNMHVCPFACVDDLKMASKKETVGTTWSRLGKTIDLEGPTQFLNQVYLDCTRREPDVDHRHKNGKSDASGRIRIPDVTDESSSIVTTTDQHIMNSPTQEERKCTSAQKTTYRIVAWSCDIQGHAEQNRLRVRDCEATGTDDQRSDAAPSSNRQRFSGE